MPRQAEFRLHELQGEDPAGDQPRPDKERFVRQSQAEGEALHHGQTILLPIRARDLRDPYPGSHGTVHAAQESVPGIDVESLPGTGHRMPCRKFRLQEPGPDLSPENLRIEQKSGKGDHAPQPLAEDAGEAEPPGLRPVAGDRRTGIGRRIVPARNLCAAPVDHCHGAGLVQGVDPEVRRLKVEQDVAAQGRRADSESPCGASNLQDRLDAVRRQPDIGTAVGLDRPAGGRAECAGSFASCFSPHALPCS
jgi:hypothetical protein